MRIITIQMILLLVCLTGCTGLREWKANGFKVGPNYRRPCVPVADDWLESSDASVVSQNDLVSDWWSAFNDPVLEQLIQTAYQQNLDLRTAGLHVLEARTQSEVSVLNLLPQSQSLSGRYLRNQLSTKTATYFPILPRNYDEWKVGFDLGWELDIWGRVRRSIESADANLDVQVENYDAILVTLVGDVAAAYIELRAFDERLRLAEENTKIQTASLKLAEARHDEGRVTGLDVGQAISNVAETRALIPVLRQGRRLTLNRIAILLGVTPYKLEPLLRDRGELPEIPTQVLVGIPADLLRRRPDIRAAERQAAAQCARIGIAEAEMFPQFTLSGEISWNASSVSDLFTSASNAGSLAPGFRWKILNYGRLKKNIHLEDLRFQQAIVAYESAVLTAHREVEDALVQFVESKERARELKISADAAAKSVELARIQYKEGKIDFGRVFVLEAALVQRQDQLVTTESMIAIALVRTYKALGGGWQLRLSTPYRGSVPTETIAITEVSGLSETEILSPNNLQLEQPIVLE